MTISEAYSYFKLYYLVNNDRSAKTLKEYDVRFLGRNGLVSVIGDIPLGMLGLDHVITWKMHMREVGLQPVYINHNLSALRWFLKFMHSKEFQVLDWHTIEFDKEEQNKPKTVLTPEEIERMVVHARTLRDKAIIRLFFGTGCRSAEELNLDRDQWEAAELVDPVNKVWEIWVMGKNQKYRPVHFYQAVKDAVDLYLSTRDDRYKPLFMSLQNRRISYAMVSRMLHDVSRRAGLEKIVTQHVFRHSFATDMAGNGLPLPLLAYELGHKDSTVTQKIYVHMDAFKARKAYAQFHSHLPTYAPKK